jgi:membrane protease YdiL (CAAX protease family)
VTGGSADPTARQLRLRENRGLLLAEFLVVAGLFVLDARHPLPFGKTPFLLALAWGSMHLRGIRWCDIGASADPRWRVLVVVGVLAGIAMEGLELFAVRPLLVKLTGQIPDLSDFRDLVGNAWMLTRLTVAMWIFVALGEEVAWRGYLLNRLADLFGRNRAGWAVALVFASIAFALSHAELGSIGVGENIAAGALLAGLYLACGRNLIAPIVAHGAYRMLDFLIIFPGHYPGLGK